MIHILCVGGLDPSGSAGIIIDSFVAKCFGAHPICIPTAITMQSYEHVLKIRERDVTDIIYDLKKALAFFDFSAVKIGMVYSPEILENVVSALYSEGIPIVYDPVMVASSGGLLSTDDLAERIANVSTKFRLITPNIDEGLKILEDESKKSARISIDQLKEMAMELGEKLRCPVLLKGGHLKDEKEAIDVLVHDNSVRFFVSERVAGGIIRGTGCAYSTLIATFLAMGDPLEIAIRRAKGALYSMINNSYSVGSNVRVLGLPDREYNVIVALSNALRELVKFLPSDFVPEVGMNIAYALPHAVRREEVCGIKGRIVRFGDEVLSMGHPEFGASDHMARVVLTAMEYDVGIRCAINIRYSQEIIECCHSLNLKVAGFSRKEEPAGVKTMEWGIARAIEEYRKATGSLNVPDVIFDKGAVGKEAMIRVLGQSPKDVLHKVRKIVYAL
ncbi:MAG: hypothetical protein DRN20_04720 [Thermoplasmata archaeon]|nr:MAG: hypothetical protein DRN20_04720 [Thermoplasmata archaeon]